MVKGVKIFGLACACVAGVFIIASGDAATGVGIIAASFSSLRET